MTKQAAGIALLRLGQEMKRIVEESCGRVTFMSISAYDNGNIIVRTQDESDGLHRVNIPLDAVLFSDGVARVNGVTLDLDGEEGAA
jgi:hypothetical protein